jgi:hypothetical protein
MAGTYGDLTAAEAATWNEYTNLRALSDWPGFDDAQDQRRAAARTWLQDRREYIERLAKGEVDGQEKGWDVGDRRSRYDFLSDANLNSGAPKHEVRLPCSGKATDAEKAYIEEREIYLTFASQYDEQRLRKQANVAWLVDRRRKLWHLIRTDPGNNEAQDREQRYDDLCVATHFGAAYDKWEQTHNKWGVPENGAGSSSGRAACKEWLETQLGISESPAGSNRGAPQPSGWQKRVFGSDGVAWCACFAVCSAWDNGVTGTGTAAVFNNIQLAKKGQGIYRGFTTDLSKVRPGDHAFIDCSTCHTGVVYDPHGPVTIEGNTSPGQEGSQYNGGTVARKQRPAGAFIGFGLVRFPDD